MGITRRSFLKGALALIAAGAATNIPAVRVIEAIAQAEPTLVRDVHAITADYGNGFAQVKHSTIDASFVPESAVINCERNYIDFDDKGLGSIEVTAHVCVVDDAWLVNSLMYGQEPVSIELKMGDTSYVLTGFITRCDHTALGKHAMADFSMTATQAVVRMGTGWSLS